MAVLIRLIEVLTAVVSVEHAPDRVEALQKHADLVLGDATTDVGNAADLSDIRARHQAFMAVKQQGVSGRFNGSHT